MAPSAPFNPPSANLPGKPFVPEWIPPPVTQEKHQFAELKSIDLSLLDSDDPAVVEHLINQVKIAIRDDGFLFLENYGVSLEQVRDSPMGHVARLTDCLLFNSFIVNLLSPNIYTIISATRTRSDSFSIPTTVVNGLVISTPMDSR